MPNKHLPMRLSRDEEVFLRHWIYDEAHFMEGQGPAKRLQVEHRALPVDLAVLIAAGMPDLAEQEAAGIGPPPAQAPTWPWAEHVLDERVAEARNVLELEGPGLVAGAVPVSTPHGARPARRIS